jgi:hypothetical protein
MANIDIFKDLTIKTNEEGVTTMSVPGAFGILVDCEYWHVGGEGDHWRYRLSGADGPRYAYSHPSEHGCQIAIKRHFVSVGLVKVPEDNSHLDDENQLIAAGILANWEARTGRPRVGDFLRFPDGSMKRFCNDTGDGQQLTKGGSFSIGRFAEVSYSGGLERPMMWERFMPTGETTKGRFWFFSHNRAGAGRGVDVFLPCRIYELVDFSMTREEAEAHPVAIACRDFWGAKSGDYQTRVEALMRGELR